VAREAAPPATLAAKVSPEGPASRRCALRDQPQLASQPSVVRCTGAREDLRSRRATQGRRSTRAPRRCARPWMKRGRTDVLAAEGDVPNSATPRVPLPFAELGALSTLKSASLRLREGRLRNWRLPAWGGAAETRLSTGQPRTGPRRPPFPFHEPDRRPVPVNGCHLCDDGGTRPLMRM
jgi:hypothetical protein